LLRKSDISHESVRKGGKEIYLDVAALHQPFTVRTMKPGDRFRPLGMAGSKKLSDFFVDRKVDRPLREEIPLVLSADEIVWVVGMEIADSVKVTETTEQVVKL
jgi:tRNA(Ile)-lysidine synthase